MTRPGEAAGIDGEDERIGLCSGCRHRQTIATDRGKRFYLCTLAATDARFVKYPRLPVRDCAGYAQGAEADDSRPPGAAERNGSP